MNQFKGLSSLPSLLPSPSSLSLSRPPSLLIHPLQYSRQRVYPRTSEWKTSRTSVRVLESDEKTRNEKVKAKEGGGSRREEREVGRERVLTSELGGRQGGKVWS